MLLSQATDHLLNPELTEGPYLSTNIPTSQLDVKQKLGP